MHSIPLPEFSTMVQLLRVLLLQRHQRIRGQAALRGLPVQNILQGKRRKTGGHAGGDSASPYTAGQPVPGRPTMGLPIQEAQVIR